MTSTRQAIGLCLVASAYALLLTATSAFAPSAFAQREIPESEYQRGDWWWVPPVELNVDKVQYRIFKSEAAGQEVGYLEYLPPQYEANPDARFPVLFILHGAGGGPQDTQYVVRGYGTRIEKGLVPPMIVIGVNGMVLSWYLDSQDGEFPVATMIAKDLVTHLDTTRRTIPHREARVLEGFSMGGYGSMHLGLKHPEVFGAVRAMASGRFDRRASQVGLRKEPGPVDERLQRRIQNGPLRIHSPEHVAANSAVVLLEENKQKIRDLGLRIWIGVGENDWHAEGATLFSQMLVDEGIDNTLVVVPGIGHDLAGIYRHVEEETRHLYTQWFGDSQVLADWIEQTQGDEPAPTSVE